MDGESEAMSRPANQEMVQGYIDGTDPNNPEPNDNRSHSYRHGFAMARADRSGKPAGDPKKLHEMADEAMRKDEGQ